MLTIYQTFDDNWSIKVFYSFSGHFWELKSYKKIFIVGSQICYQRVACTFYCIYFISVIMSCLFIPNLYLLTFFFILTPVSHILFLLIKVAPEFSSPFTIILLSDEVILAVVFIHFLFIFQFLKKSATFGQMSYLRKEDYYNYKFFFSSLSFLML